MGVACGTCLPTVQVLFIAFMYLCILVWLLSVFTLNKFELLRKKKVKCALKNVPSTIDNIFQKEKCKFCFLKTILLPVCFLTRG